MAKKNKRWHGVWAGGRLYPPMILGRPPDDHPGGRSESATARIHGGPLAPEISGFVHFVDVPEGTWVCAEIEGLPAYRPAEAGRPPVGPHGFHIHEFGSCLIGDPAEPFRAAGEHWNPDAQPHGNHAGDFPVLFSNHGRARMCFFTDRFRVADVVGRAVIIHESPDDYRTQPAGASGRRLACGVVTWDEPNHDWG